MVPEIPLKIGNCQNNQAGSFSVNPGPLERKAANSLIEALEASEFVTAVHPNFWAGQRSPKLPAVSYKHSVTTVFSYTYTTLSKMLQPHI